VHNMGKRRSLRFTRSPRFVAAFVLLTKNFRTNEMGRDEPFLLPSAGESLGIGWRCRASHFLNLVKAGAVNRYPFVTKYCTCIPVHVCVIPIPY